VGSAPAQNARGKQTDHHHPTNPQATPDSRAGLFIQQRLQSRIELLLSQDSLHTLIPFFNNLGRWHPLLVHRRCSTLKGRTHRMGDIDLDLHLRQHRIHANNRGRNSHCLTM